METGERERVPEADEVDERGDAGGEGPQEIIDAARDELENPADETNEG